VGFMAARLGLRMARERAAPSRKRPLTTYGLVSAAVLVMGIIYVCALGVIALSDSSTLTSGQVVLAVIYAVAATSVLKGPSGDA
jgi:hypothetical protein